jgi:septal ring factor EnvC (AmiA/AmiB activator)
MKSFSETIFIVSATAFLWCGSTAVTLSRGDGTTERQDKLNGGYYLLHHLCNDEAQLPLLIDLKHASAEIEAFADKISRTAKESNSLLEQMQDGDPAIKFNRNPLPAIERDVRESIQDEKQHQLLFGTKDAEFERALLVSQIEASNYAHNIAKVLSDQETDSNRIKSLAKISARWLAINQEAFRFLSTIR